MLIRALIVVLATWVHPVVLVLHRGFLVSGSGSDHWHSQGSTESQTDCQLEFAHLHINLQSIGLITLEGLSLTTTVADETHTLLHQD